jgi:trehalose/maltose transport system substrate-binding protein
MRHWSSGFQSITSAMTAGRAGITHLPAGPEGRFQTVGGFSLGVSKYSRHPREAASLVLYLTSAEVQKRRALRRGYLPTRTDLRNDPELLQALPQLRVLRNAAPESWVIRPSTVTGEKYADVSKAYYETVHGVLAGRVEAGPALAALANNLARLTGSRGASRD